MVFNGSNQNETMVISQGNQIEPMVFHAETGGFLRKASKNPVIFLCKPPDSTIPLYCYPQIAQNYPQSDLDCPQIINRLSTEFFHFSHAILPKKERITGSPLGKQVILL